MASDPPEIALSSRLSELFSRTNKDTDGWAGTLSAHDIDTVQDLLETDIEDMVEILEADGKSWSKGKRNALRSILKNSPILNLPANWSFLSRASVPPVTPGSSLNRSHSVGSSSKSTKPLFTRKPHNGLKEDVICRPLSCFARLLGFMALTDPDINTVCYLMAIYHGLSLSLSPYPFEYTGMALALSKLFADQTVKQSIEWKTKLRSMFKNFRMGCYPKECPFPIHPLWDQMLLSKWPHRKPALLTCSFCRCARRLRGIQAATTLSPCTMYSHYICRSRWLQIGVFAPDGSSCRRDRLDARPLCTAVDHAAEFNCAPFGHCPKSVCSS